MTHLDLFVHVLNVFNDEGVESTEKNDITVIQLQPKVLTQDHMQPHLSIHVN